jgi:hypothetical protein
MRRSLFLNLLIMPAPCYQQTVLEGWASMARGQTAFEYLLIIGGSIMLASIMLVAVQGNLVAVSPGIDIRVSSIKKLTAAIETGISCSDCDAAFVNVGEYQSVSNYMLTPDSVDSGKIADGSILYTDVNTGQIQRRSATTAR